MKAAIYTETGQVDVLKIAELKNPLQATERFLSASTLRVSIHLTRRRGADCFHYPMAWIAFF